MNRTSARRSARFRRLFTTARRCKVLCSLCLQQTHATGSGSAESGPRFPSHARLPPHAPRSPSPVDTRSRRRAASALGIFRPGSSAAGRHHGVVGSTLEERSGPYGLVEKHHSVHSGSLHHHIARIHFDFPAVPDHQNFAVFVYYFLRVNTKSLCYQVSLQVYVRQHLVNDVGTVPSIHRMDLFHIAGIGPIHHQIDSQIGQILFCALRGAASDNLDILEFRIGLTETEQNFGNAGPYTSRSAMDKEGSVLQLSRTLNGASQFTKYRFSY